MSAQQLEIGFARKEAGQRRAAIAASPWHRSALGLIAAMARGHRFTADNVVAELGTPNDIATNRNNAIGALFTAARKAGLIEPDGYRPSTRPESHGRVIAVWVRR